ncbi:formate dehydrogenase gamma subunit [Stella humosa]|uniref:Formate dehydrogenase gamma subunit n=1 Tax=Stella humosa TaxID=94 RepID=A0A3N1MQV8_9PROT|nr:formate dehydrogenase subunit gamma [Stella humosa]ROQ03336.1 formate dehydrogenase gamma subunit [Stella humosa]BBK29623.1 formate dehydrogenase subunit gamma [Stella humosa]
MAGPAAASSSDTFDAAVVIEIAEGLRGLDGPLLPILHAVNDRLGHVDQRAVPLIADILNLSRAEVHGVVGFYHDFRRAPAGRHRVQVCRAEACQAMGGEALASRLEQVFGVPFGQTTVDGRVTLEAVYCLGNCALSPAAMIDGEPVGRATVARIVEGVAR